MDNTMGFMLSRWSAKAAKASASSKNEAMVKPEENQSNLNTSINIHQRSLKE